MKIDWWTLFLQTVNFLLLVWLLQHFLYKPVRAVFEKRRKLAEQALNKAEIRREGGGCGQSTIRGEVS